MDFKGSDRLAEKYNMWSFVLCILCLLFSVHALYAALNQSWSVAPPLFALWISSVAAFVSGIMGVQVKGVKFAKTRSWVTITISFSLSAILFMGLAVELFARDTIATTHSPNGDYTIKLYTENGGAASSINVVGIVDGPLWFRKNIYDDRNMHKADVKWLNDHTISINNHVLDLERGETFSE